ncbi:MAG TPA: hemolysin family protein [Actinocrinis sp.]|nr:hemolysin family protein [Actinocrinis sp.]
MTAAEIWLVLGGALAVVLAWLAAAVGGALARITPAHAEELAVDGGAGPARVLRLTEDTPGYVNLVLLIQVFGEVGATVLAAMLADSWWGRTWYVGAITVLVMAAISYVAVGVSARTLGRQHAERVARAAAPFLFVLGRLLSPIVKASIMLGNALTPGQGFRDGPFATEAEVRALLDIAEQHSEIEDAERRMVHSVFELGDTLVKEVMVPRTDMIFIERTKTARQALSLALRSGFSRIPVIGENADDIVGIAYLKDLVRRTQDGQDAAPGTVTAGWNGAARSAAATERVDEVMRPAIFVPDSKHADVLLRDMQAQRIHLAVVIDEYGGTAGLVTIEDILEEIVGEITDEYDQSRPPEVEWLGEPGDLDAGARVSARLALDELGDLFGRELEDEDVETVGGLLAKCLGLVPIPGSAIRHEGLSLVAESTEGRRRRVGTVLVRQTGDEEQTDEEQKAEERS